MAIPREIQLLHFQVCLAVLKRAVKRVWSANRVKLTLHLFDYLVFDFINCFFRLQFLEACTSFLEQVENLVVVETKAHVHDLGSVFRQACLVQLASDVTAKFSFEYLDIFAAGVISCERFPQLGRDFTLHSEVFQSCHGLVRFLRVDEGLPKQVLRREQEA